MRLFICLFVRPSVLIGVDAVILCIHKRRHLHLLVGEKIDVKVKINRSKTSTDQGEPTLNRVAERHTSEWYSRLCTGVSACVLLHPHRSHLRRTVSHTMKKAKDTEAFNADGLKGLQQPESGHMFRCSKKPASWKRLFLFHITQPAISISLFLPPALILSLPLSYPSCLHFSSLCLSLSPSHTHTRTHTQTHFHTHTTYAHAYRYTHHTHTYVPTLPHTETNAHTHARIPCLSIPLLHNLPAEASQEGQLYNYSHSQLPTTCLLLSGLW